MIDEANAGVNGQHDVPGVPATSHISRLSLLVIVSFVAAFLVLSVDVPFWDEWAFPPSLMRVLADDALGPWLIKQEADSRPVIPKVWMLIHLGVLGSFHPFAQQVLQLAVMLLTMGCALAGVRRAIPDARPRKVASLLVVLLFCNFVHHETYLRGDTLGFIVPVALTILVGFASPQSPAVAWMWATTASVVAALTYANGLLLFVAAAPWERLRAAPRAAAVHVCVALGLGAGLLGTFDPAVHTSTRLPPDLLSGLTHTLGVLASPWVGAAVWPILQKGGSVLPGVVLHILFVLSCILGAAVIMLSVRALWQRRHGGLSVLRPWLGLMIFSLGSAAAVGLGRSTLGPAQAFSSRYATLTVPVALVVVLAITRTERSTRWVAVPACLVLVMNSCAGLVVASSWMDIRRAGRDMLPFVKVCSQTAVLHALAPGLEPSHVVDVSDFAFPIQMASKAPPPVPCTDPSLRALHLSMRAPRWSTPTFQKPTPALVTATVSAPGSDSGVLVLRRQQARMCLGAGRTDVGNALTIEGTYRDVPPGPGTLEVWGLGSRGELSVLGCSDVLVPADAVASSGHPAFLLDRHVP